MRASSNFPPRTANYGAAELGGDPSPFPQKLNTALIHKNPSAKADDMACAALDIVAEFRRTHDDMGDRDIREFTHVSRNIASAAG